MPREIPISIAALERHLDGVLDRPITALDPVERAILAIGVHELLCHPAISPSWPRNRPGRPWP